MSILTAHEEGRRLRVGIVGCGGHAYRSIFPCFDYLAAEIVATCDVDLTRAQKYATHFGARGAYSKLADMIEAGGIDAVVLAVGPAQHPPLACEALAAGLHVWMEKPPAEDVAGVDRMIAARDKYGKVVSVGFKKAFMPVARRIKETLDVGTLGSIRTIAARFPLGMPADGKQVLAEKRATNWLGNGVHPLSLLVHLAGRPEKITTHRSRLGGAFIVFEFPSGAVASLHDTYGQAASSVLERYEIVCEKGNIICENNVRLTIHRPGAPFDYKRGFDFTAGSDDTAAITYDVQHTLSTLYNKGIFIQGFVQELDHFVSACLDGKTATIGTLEQARVVMECYEAALRSEGESVCV
jgi:predicted dehydrogenase